LVLRNLRCLEFVCVLGQQRQPVHRVIKIHITIPPEQLEIGIKLSGKSKSTVGNFEERLALLFWRVVSWRWGESRLLYRVASHWSDGNGHSRFFKCTGSRASLLL
jgi:hypothetical protein